MNFKKQEHIPYDYVWSHIDGKLSKPEIDSYNRYTDEVNNAKSTESREFYLNQRHKYLVECFRQYEESRLYTADNKPVEIQGEFNHGIARNILAEPGTAEAGVLYTKEKTEVLSPTVKICKSDATDRYLLYRDGKPVSAIVVLRKNEAFGAKQNIITTVYTDKDYQKQGLGSALLKIVQKHYGKNLTVSPDLTEAGFKLLKPKQGLSM